MTFRTPQRLVVAAIAIVATAGIVAVAQRGRGNGTPLLPNGECPPGMTMTRPGNCEAPELPAPSIVDYRPTSTLIVPQHTVPKAQHYGASES